MSQTVPLPTPPDPPEPSADTVASGPLIPAMKLMKLFSPDDWEAFVLEWAHSLESEYRLVEKCKIMIMDIHKLEDRSTWFDSSGR